MEIRLRDLGKSYGDLAVFANFNHTFPDGAPSCILGPSGRGKTTLLRLIAGLEAPDAGQIAGIEGAKIAMVFQEDRLLENLTAERNVLLTARPSFAREDARALLSELGLDARRAPLREFSGGMRRRVAIARALAADFDLLLLDEPFAGLDEEARAQAIRVILSRAQGKTLLCATHGPDDANLLNAQVLRLEQKSGPNAGKLLTTRPGFAREDARELLGI